MRDEEQSTIEVLFAPDYTQYNPYQARLKQELAELGVEVQLSSGLSPGKLRELADADEGVLHLHWLFPYFQSETRIGLTRRAFWFSVKLLYLKFAGVQLVWTAHDYITHSRENEQFSKRFRRMIFRLFDSVVVHCEAAKDRLHREYNFSRDYSDRMTTIVHPHFLDYPNTIERDAARERLQLEHDDKVFLFFGNIKQYKGVDELIDAFQRLEDEDAQLFIAGSTTEKTEDQVMRAVEADPRISGDFRFVPTDEIQFYLNAADVVVLPFRDILTSGSVVLAMSFGKPVIAPAIGCIPETVTDGGAFLYDPESADGLYDALRATEEHDLAAMGERNREHIEQFDWLTAARETKEVYESGN
ncbi:glycosyltransferase family 4 protein [Salinigranum halophilum]|uniref:glycosyltransferase family 4 protein n=1 Tax=Salinigranum halophilum TaxID=2565931 RepID=UPI0010A8121B|nr:glycosyltransferase family 4 protein [Salinigranum halophilum]